MEPRLNPRARQLLKSSPPRCSQSRPNLSNSLPMLNSLQRKQPPFKTSTLSNLRRTRLRQLPRNQCVQLSLLPRHSRSRLRMVIQMLRWIQEPQLR